MANSTNAPNNRSTVTRKKTLESNLEDVRKLKTCSDCLVSFEKRWKSQYLCKDCGSYDYSPEEISEMGKREWK